MGVAVADSWHDVTMKTTGAKFTGRYMWEPQLQKHGGLRLKGSLKDTNNDDGHNVYIYSKVEGYPWVRTKGVQKKTVSIDKTFFDSALLVTDLVEVQVCRDRGSLRPDNCSELRKFER
jgi:hypothetical protein